MLRATRKKKYNKYTFTVTHPIKSNPGQKIPQLIILPIGTALQGAVLAIPAGDAQARSVLTLAMLVTARIAQFAVAEFATPTSITTTAIAHATSMLATVQVAQFLRTVLAAPLRLASARLTVQIERPVAGTIGQTLQRILVHGGTVRSLPAFLADACSLGTEAMP